MWILVAMLVCLVGVLLWARGRLLALQRQYLQAWLEVEMGLQARYAWVSRWIQTAKNTITPEQTVLKTVIEARQSASRALKNLQHQPEHSRAVQEWLHQEAALAASLRELRRLVLQTPALLHHEGLVDLRAEMRQLEQHLARACEDYNRKSKAYNHFRHRAPHAVFARALGHQQDVLTIPVFETVAFMDVVNEV